MRLLDGKVAIVTGGARGLGKSHCFELARHGCAVVINDPGVGLHGEPATEDPARLVVDQIRASGGRAIAIHSSVVDFNACSAVVAEAVDTFGRLDVVVNNAGIVRDRMINSMSEDDFDAVIAVHLRGTFNMTRHAGAHWRAISKAGGKNVARIINTTSGAAFWGNIGQSAYAAAKAAIISLTVVTALEMAPYGVTANAISPLAATRMTDGLPAFQRTDGSFDRLDPANASPVVAYLAADASSWLTGQVFRIEGGTLRRMIGWHQSETAYNSKSGLGLETEELVDGMRMLFGTMPAGLQLGSPQ